MNEDLRQLAESILTDLTQDTPIANAMLKAKVFAVKKDDKDLQSWIEHELDGYEENLPKYRLLDAGVKVDIHRGYQEVLGYNYPVDMVEEEKTRERLLHLPIHASISEVEELCTKSDGGTIHLDIPVNIWYHHMRHCINGDIQRAYQIATVASLKQIMVKVKSLLIDYFLKIDKNDSLSFLSLIKKEIPIMKITAGIINTGSGSVITNDVAIVSGSNISINKENIQELRCILLRIEEIMKSLNSDDYKEISEELKTEMKKDDPSRNVIKRALQAINGIASGIVSGVIANQVSPLVTSAIALL
ncbi:hypothetical protein [uncultured Porphyromonas sp.]|mgnify:CR=1 FL=1|uniref:AbiTii domain-containing protein n=1 Tax=uncultured Porphyromonas sp. TaxID=159274 RepID=UPI0026055736|nr:hypothetical protein [uncultured Porphyromonas sp.]